MKWALNMSGASRGGSYARDRMSPSTTHSDDQEDVVGLVLLGGGLAGHADHPVQEGGEVSGAVQLHLADGVLVGS